MDHAYLNDSELAGRLNIGEDKLKVMRAEPGFPPRDGITNKRYWPAVKQWLDARHGLGGTMPDLPDGEEHWPARK